MTARSGSTPPVLPARAAVIGVGARTSNGLTALQVATAVRAGELVPRPSHMIDRGGNAIATARLASIADDVLGTPRLAALAAPALVQAAFPLHAQDVARGQPRAPVVVLLAVAERGRPGRDRDVERTLLPDIAARSGVPIDLARSRVLPAGRAGGVAAFDAALRELDEGRAEAVIVGGVDTWFDPDALEALDSERRLHGPDTENGFIPGEGAGFVALTRNDATRGAPRVGRVVSIGFGREPNPFGSEEPNLAVGMTEAARGAAAAVPKGSRQIAWLMTDMVDERHRVDEWVFAEARIAPWVDPRPVHDQVLLSTGDLGAASIPVIVAVACTFWEIGCGRGDCALLAASSDGPPPEGSLRGAMLLAAPR